MRHVMMLLIFHLVFHLVSADVIREDGYHDYEGQFTVEHKGRMLRVLMFFHNIQPEECALHCVRHLRCRTFNYHLEKKDCELTDVDFDKMNADTITYGWYNYGTPTKVDGGWSAWRNFTVCTKTCGSGTLKQWRDCDSPIPEHGGADCKGRMERKVKCNTHGCPVNGGWSNWKNSTNCTKSCGNGTMEQIRECDSPKPMYGGADCYGIKKRTVECNTHECPVDGGFSNWKNATNCTKPCGNGTIEQIRVCDSPKPIHGGAHCKGIKKRTVECNTHECPVDGGFSNWKNSTDCTKSCGNGTIEQIRVCDSPKPIHGGADCKGIKKRTVECNTHECPVDGGFSNWKNSTDCTKSCGNGTIEQIRECDSPKPMYGGADCYGIKKRTVECKTHECPVDGGFSNWKNATNCTKSCGNGTIEQIRECDSPKPIHGGAECKGIKQRTVECNAHKCPVLAVNVALGKTTKQSSTSSGSSSSQAVDGDTDTFSYTKYGPNPWWEVVLGGVKEIKKIILNAMEPNAVTNRALLVDTRQKNTGFWILCKDIRERKEQKSEFTCNDQSTKAQYFRIRSTEKCILYIYEVEIFDY